MPNLNIRPPKRGFQPLTALEAEQVRRLTPQQRVAAMCAGRLTYGQLCWWAARWPHEVPRINGEFAFIAAFEPEATEAAPAAHTSHPHVHRVAA